MPRDPQTLYMLEHATWGDSLQWTDFNRREIYGWFDHPTIGKLQLGDRLVTTLESGNQAEYEVTDLRYQDDPEDMFFGRVRDVRYVPPVRCNHEGEPHPATAAVWEDGRLVVATCDEHAADALAFAGTGAYLQRYEVTA